MPPVGTRREIRTRPLTRGTDNHGSWPAPRTITRNSQEGESSNNGQVPHERPHVTETASGRQTAERSSNKHRFRISHTHTHMARVAPMVGLHGGCACVVMAGRDARVKSQIEAGSSRCTKPDADSQPRHREGIFHLRMKVRFPNILAAILDPVALRPCFGSERCLSAQPGTDGRDETSKRWTRPWQRGSVAA